MSDTSIELVEVDFNQPERAAAVVQLLDIYARDPMGGGTGLSDDVKARLPQELARRESARAILAIADGNPAGLAIALEGFSTFACQPLLNIHDLVVAPTYRGRGIAKRLLRHAEDIARELGCCKLTLEVLEGNRVAQAAYRSVGFSGYELDPTLGKALFWEKKLD